MSHFDSNHSPDNREKSDPQPVAHQNGEGEKPVQADPDIVARAEFARCDSDDIGGKPCAKKRPYQPGRRPATKRRPRDYIHSSSSSSDTSGDDDQVDSGETIVGVTPLFPDKLSTFREWTRLRQARQRTDSNSSDGDSNKRGDYKSLANPEECDGLNRTKPGIGMMIGSPVLASDCMPSVTLESEAAKHHRMGPYRRPRLARKSVGIIDDVTPLGTNRMAEAATERPEALLPEIQSTPFLLDCALAATSSAVQDSLSEATNADVCVHPCEPEVGPNWKENSAIHVTPQAASPPLSHIPRVAAAATITPRLEINDQAIREGGSASGNCCQDESTPGARRQQRCEPDVDCNRGISTRAAFPPFIAPSLQPNAARPSAAAVSVITRPEIIDLALSDDDDHDHGWCEEHVGCTPVNRSHHSTQSEIDPTKLDSAASTPPPAAATIAKSRQEIIDLMMFENDDTDDNDSGSVNAGRNVTETNDLARAASPPPTRSSPHCVFGIPAYAVATADSRAVASDAARNDEHDRQELNCLHGAEDDRRTRKRAVAAPSPSYDSNSLPVLVLPRAEADDEAPCEGDHNKDGRETGSAPINGAQLLELDADRHRKISIVPAPSALSLLSPAPPLFSPPPAPTVTRRPEIIDLVTIEEDDDPDDLCDEDGSDPGDECQDPIEPEVSLISTMSAMAACSPLPRALDPTPCSSIKPISVTNNAKHHECPARVYECGFLIARKDDLNEKCLATSAIPSISSPRPPHFPVLLPAAVNARAKAYDQAMTVEGRDGDGRQYRSSHVNGLHIPVEREADPINGASAINMIPPPFIRRPPPNFLALTPATGLTGKSTAEPSDGPTFEGQGCQDRVARVSGFQDGSESVEEVSTVKENERTSLVAASRWSAASENALNHVMDGDGDNSNARLPHPNAALSGRNDPARETNHVGAQGSTRNKVTCNANHEGAQSGAMADISNEIVDLTGDDNMVDSPLHLLLANTFSLEATGPLIMVERVSDNL